MDVEAATDWVEHSHSRCLLGLGVPGLTPPCQCALSSLAGMAGMAVCTLVVSWPDFGNMYVADVSLLTGKYLMLTELFVMSTRNDDLLT